MAITYPIIWPACLLKPASVLPLPQMQSRGGGAGVLGVEQVVQSPAWAWSIKLSAISIRTRQQILAWRTIEGQLDGRAGTILVPVYDWARSPSGRRKLAPYGDGATHSDGSEFAGPATNITMHAAAAVNATTLDVVWHGTAPQPGQHFSLGQRLHRVVAMDVTGTGRATLTIRPWLREAAAVDDVLDFDEPACVCRLAKDDGMAMDLELWKFAAPSVDFVEAF